MSTFSGSSALMIDVPKSALRPAERKPWPQDDKPKPGARRKWLQPLPPPTQIEPPIVIPRISVRQIVDAACQHFQVSLVEFLSPRRWEVLTDTRCVVGYLACQLTKLSLPTIGYAMGGLDHTTIIHHRARIKKLFAEDADEKPLSDRQRALLDAVEVIRTKLVTEAGHLSSDAPI